MPDSEKGVVISMKNKVYYTLFLFYFAVLIFILYINGVFAGEVTSYSNLFINIAILIVIGVLFTISAVNFAWLNKCTDALENTAAAIRREHKEKNANLWNEYKNKEKPFGNSYLDDAFVRYQRRVKGCTTRHGLTQTCELEEYINEDLLDQLSSSHFNSSISGTMTGLGILGTFIGLSLGLGAFSGNDIFTISENVGPLLEGMKVAFHTSVYGIFFSLVFTFIYRGIMANSYRILEDFLSCFKECVMPVTASAGDENSKTMLVYQANMANSMKTMLELLKGNSMEQTTGVERIVNEFSEQLSLKMGTDFTKLGHALNQAADSQTVYAHNYQSMEKTAKELLEANRVMQEMLEHTLNRQERFSKELKKQQETLAETCTALSDDIGNQLYTFNQMRDLYEK